MRHPLLVKLEDRLKSVFDRIDDYLEDRYGDLYPLHPNRPRRGETTNKESDGLFNVGASFSPGYGSTYGRGYVVDIDMVTLERVPPEVKKKMYEEVVRELERILPKAFPERELKVSRDGNIFKIHGEFLLTSGQH
jgi:hypothetical protein